MCACVCTCATANVDEDGVVVVVVVAKRFELLFVVYINVVLSRVQSDEIRIKLIVSLSCFKTTITFTIGAWSSSGNIAGSWKYK